MKRKLAIAALALSMVVSNVAPYTVMTAHAAENDEIGDILDDVFGGNKPDNSQGEGTHDDNTAGGGLIEDNGGSDDSSSDNSGSENSGSGNEGGNSGSDNSGSENTGNGDEDDDIGDILDDIFGGSKPDNSQGGGTHDDNTAGGGLIEDDNSGSSDTGNTGNSGSGNSGNTGSSNAGSSTTVTDPDTGKTTTTTVNADGSTTVVTTDPATGETTSVIVSAGTTTAVDVTDPAILALLPEAMIVTTPEGLPFVHALDVTRTVYSVWGGGQQLDAFYLTDVTGAPVAMQAVDIVTAPDGKTYVNVTLDPAVTGATVQAAEEQRVAFAKLYGIDGVMINGVLADTFVALAS